ncbi:alpha-1,2-mannosidase, putative subfamily [Teratosphaeria nubilosa]|uniref:Alpha-1,2-mannosidase, putative subfamily n=1 Tax=Teratosphaeria nubilosa TaxID=161662 RepID=A0A6G1LE43_9PEZI|nr:alpha-1,2-mannosidase, putative subfamily [Teratosphaeria nubilosa]
MSLLSFAAVAGIPLVLAQGGADILSFVDPLIGTINGGHVFPGATLPFGMAKAVADVNGGDLQGGFALDYDPQANVTGFSHMHDSGTGGAQSLGNFPLFPQSFCPNDDINNCVFSKDLRATPFINTTAKATPGYFSVKLSTEVTGEMTVTNHTALYRFTFPSQSKIPSKETLSPLILADLTNLADARSTGSVDVDAATGRIKGSADFSASFGFGKYTLHFCADFSGAAVRDTGTFNGGHAGMEPKNISVTGGGSDPKSSAGAWTRFHAPDAAENYILARVGVSFITPDQACTNGEKEIPHFDFAAVKSAAEAAWIDQLGRIEVKPGEGVPESLQKVFWSGVYRSNISPQDYTGENPLWDSAEPYYDSYYCIWDSFRSTHTLITILDPYSQILMMRSLVDIYRHEGWLPDCRMSLCKGYTQGGSNADVLLAEFYLKLHTIAQDVDWLTVYAAVRNDAENEPDNWGVEGRGGLTSWKKLGYIPTDDDDHQGIGPFTRSISRTVEYAYNDFCVATLAQAVNAPTTESQLYFSRSGNWKNMFLANQTSYIHGKDTNFVGFLQPRYLDQTFGFQDPIFCSPLLDFASCYLQPDGHETYEGSCWLYTFFVPHDMAALITLLGGPDEFVRRLDFLHESGLLYIGDEQAFLPVFQYHYAGRPAKSAERAHFYIPSQFNDSHNGIAGNDDSGAMGSFVALAMMGIFPNAGQDVYLITPPFFEEWSVTNNITGKVATVRNVNFDAGYKNIYIQEAKLNNAAYTKNWVGHSFFLEGGVLELVLGDKESEWGTKKEDLPPSLSTST